MENIVEIDFKLDDWGILLGGVEWTEIKCPHCKTYHSQNFLFNLEKDKTEYIGNPCNNCGGQVKVKISLETNNQLFDYMQKRIARIHGKGNRPLTEFF